MAEYVQKNRRYKGAKFSEYRLKKLVQAFAHNMTAKDAARATGFSVQTVNDVFMRLRKHLYAYGFMKVHQRETPGRPPARYIYLRKYRGAPEKYDLFYEAEVLHRIYFTLNGRAVKRYAANNDRDMADVMKCFNYNKIQKKYVLIEELSPGIDGKPSVTREFNFADYKKTSTIIINEINLTPNEVFFRWLWKLLLKQPM